MKHTKGPWEVRNVSGAGIQIWATVDLGPSKCEGTDRASGPHLQPIYRVEIQPSLSVGKDGKAYAMLSYEDWRQFPTIAFDEMQKANAYLMAASPLMYDALKRAHSCATLKDDGTCGGCYISEVLAKAEGSGAREA